MAISGNGEQTSGNKQTVLRVALSAASLSANTATPMLIFPTGTTMVGVWVAPFAGWLAALSGYLYSSSISGTTFFQVYRAAAASPNTFSAVSGAVTASFSPSASIVNYPAPWLSSQQISFAVGDVFSIYVTSSGAATSAYAHAALMIST